MALVSKDRVYLIQQVIADADDESKVMFGDVVSVWATQSAAEEEAARISANINHAVVEYTIQSTPKRLVLLA